MLTQYQLSSQIFTQYWLEYQFLDSTLTQISLIIHIFGENSLIIHDDEANDEANALITHNFGEKLINYPESDYFTIHLATTITITITTRFVINIRARILNLGVCRMCYKGEARFEC